MDEREKNIVTHSTPKSREAKIPSKLAIAETLFLSLLTWFITYYFDTLWYIISAIAIAPFLLLKSDRSTQKAIEWFTTTYKDDKQFYKKPQFWILILTITFSIYFILFLLSTQWIIHSNVWILNLFNFMLGIIMGIVVLGIGIMGSLITTGVGLISMLVIILALLVLITGGLIGLISGMVFGILGIILAITIEGEMDTFAAFIFGFTILILLTLLAPFLFFYALVLQITITTIYTFKYTKDTLFNMANNYYEQTMIYDTFYSPELLPNISKTNNYFYLFGLWKEFHNNEDILLKVLPYIFTPFWILGYFYRWSIKSTAWFYFPLAYLANIEALTNKGKQEEHYQLQTWTILSYANIFTGILLLIYFGLEKFVSFLPWGDKVAKLSDALVLFLTNISEYSVWLLVISVILYALVRIRISFRSHMHKESESKKLLYFFIRVQYILYMVFLGWNVIHLVNIHLMPKLLPLLNSTFNTL